MSHATPHLDTSAGKPKCSACTPLITFSTHWPPGLHPAPLAGWWDGGCYPSEWRRYGRGGKYGAHPSDETDQYGIPARSISLWLPPHAAVAPRIPTGELACVSPVAAGAGRYWIWGAGDWPGLVEGASEPLALAGVGGGGTGDVPVAGGWLQLADPAVGSWGFCRARDTWTRGGNADTEGDRIGLEGRVVADTCYEGRGSRRLNQCSMSSGRRLYQCPMTNAQCPTALVIRNLAAKGQ